METEDISVKQRASFALKGGLFTLTALQLLNDDLSQLTEDLEQKIQQAPKFFKHAPVVIDVQQLSNQANLNLGQLNEILRNYDLVPVGLRGAHESLQNSAIQLGLALISDTKKNNQKESTKLESDPKNQSNNVTHQVREVLTGTGTATRVIRTPIRSGQQIYAPAGDLLVMSSVSHGAELLADGHIHVHGPLRGRALAGINGDQNTMIFCKSLEAELVSIAGQYRISEDLKDSPLWKQPAMICLKGGRLHISEL